MIKTRAIDVSFWNDEFITNLSPLEKYFYSYLITNPRVSKCGIYKLDITSASKELSVDEELVVKMLGFFQSCGKLIYAGDTDEIFLINGYKYNMSQLDSKECNIVNMELKAIRSSMLKRLFYGICKDKCSMGQEVLECIFKGIQV